VIQYYYTPTRIYLGYDSIKRLGEVIKEFGRKAFVLFSRSFALRYGYTDLISKLLSNEGITYKFYIGIKPNPPASQCNEVAKAVKEFNPDVIIAFGGGSVIDAAKAVSVVASLGGKTSNYFYPKIVKDDITPIIAIPTTCGTGSEVTKYAIITDEVNRRKAVIVGEPLIPKVALVDPSVLKHLPRDMISWTSLDALSHALEAYMSKSSNVFSDIYALNAVELILGSITNGVKYETNSLLNLHLASTLAGMAINIAGTTLIHALGYYLTTHHEVHHGLANALVMPYVLYRSLKVIKNKVGRLLHVFKASSIDELVIKLINLLDTLNIPNSLLDVGVKLDELDKYKTNVINYRRNLENEPLEVNEELVKTLITEALKGRKAFLNKVIKVLGKE